MMQQVILKNETNKTCLHCKTSFLPDTAGSDYCCLGCQTVALTIESLGLDKYYAFNKLKFENKKAASPKYRSYAWLDDPAILGRYGSQKLDGLYNVIFPLDGIHCAGCLWVIEELPKTVAGIKNSSATVSSGEANITFDPKIVTAREIAILLDSLGYPVRLTKSDNVASESQSTRYLWRLGVAAFVALNTMMFGVSLFQGLFTGIEDGYGYLFRWVSLLVTIPAVTYCAMPFYNNSIFAARLKRFHIDQPIVIAIISGFILSVWNTIQGSLYVYYDSIAALIFFMLLGRFIQARALERARLESKLTGEVLPEIATLSISGRSVEQLAAEVRRGDLVVVRSGEVIPIDGYVSLGKGEVDFSILTGESAPVKISLGDKVYAGTRLLIGELQVVTETNQSESRIGVILEQLQRADLSKNFFSRFSEQVSGYFVIITFLIALLGFCFWLPQGIEAAASVFLTILIVSCPCALGIAVPAALGISVGRSARQGIYVFDPLVFDSFLNIKAYLFDKTGTLTSDHTELVKIVNYSRNDIDLIKQIVMSLASMTPNHPISRGIFKSCNQVKQVVKDVKVFPGNGVEGRVNNIKYLFGSLNWLNEQKILCSQELENLSSSGMTISGLGSDSRLLALFFFQAEVRHELKEFMCKLSGEKWILSGDTKSAVLQAANALDIPASNAIASLTPEQKADFIKTFKEPTLMIGDGVNDAPALCAATVGVGIKGGLEVTLPVADIYLSSGKVEQLLDFELCVRRTKSCIVTILASSLIYNVVGVGLTVSGMMNPLVAAIIMPLNSLGVLALALWWPRYRWV